MFLMRYSVKLITSKEEYFTDLNVYLKCSFSVWLQSGVLEKERLMLLLNLFYNKMTAEMQNSLASPRLCMRLVLVGCTSI